MGLLLAAAIASEETIQCRPVCVNMHGLCVSVDQNIINHETKTYGMMHVQHSAQKFSHSLSKQAS